MNLTRSQAKTLANAILKASKSKPAPKSNRGSRTAARKVSARQTRRQMFKVLVLWTAVILFAVLAAPYAIRALVGG